MTALVISCGVISCVFIAICFLTSSMTRGSIAISSMIYWAVGRLSGRFCNISMIKVSSFCEMVIFFKGVGFSLMMRSLRFAGVPLLEMKGRFIVSNSNIVTPNDQISVDASTYRLSSLHISGLIYAPVPPNHPFPINPASPKSPNFNTLSPLINKFPGLISLCTISILCIAISPVQHCASTNIAAWKSYL